MKVVFVAVEVSPAESKPPAAVGERISKGEIHDLGATAPLSTRAFFLEQGSAGGPVKSSPKLVELIGSIRLAQQRSPCIACTAVAVPSVCSRVSVSAYPSASMARRGCQASCSSLATR